MDYFTPLLMEMMIAMRILLSKIYMAQVNVLRSLSASVAIRKRLDSRLRNLKRKHTHTHTHTHTHKDWKEKENSLILK